MFMVALRGPAGPGFPPGGETSRDEQPHGPHRSGAIQFKIMGVLDCYVRSQLGQGRWRDPRAAVSGATAKDASRYSTSHDGTSSQVRKLCASML